MDVTPAKQRVLDRLKRADAITVSDLAAELDLTSMAVRLHLDELGEVGWVEKVAGERRGRGRPAAKWRLTEAADGQFEDRHGELTVGLIDAMREALGEDGLARVVAARTAKQVEAYRRQISGDLAERVRDLAAIRTREGYRAEARQQEDGSWLLIEHHCPICHAARACTGLCASELEVFRAALGESVTVERTKHLLTGDRRCVYRVAPAS